MLKVQRKLYLCTLKLQKAASTNYILYYQIFELIYAISAKP